MAPPDEHRERNSSAVFACRDCNVASRVITLQDDDLGMECPKCGIQEYLDDAVRLAGRHASIESIESVISNIEDRAKELLHLPDRVGNLELHHPEHRAPIFVLIDPEELSE